MAESAKGDKSELQVEKTNLENENLRLKANLESSTEENAQLMTEKESLKAMAESAKGDISELKGEKTNLENENLRLGDELNRTKEELSQAKKDLSNLQSSSKRPPTSELSRESVPNKKTKTVDADLNELLKKFDKGEGKEIWEIMCNLGMQKGGKCAAIHVAAIGNRGSRECFWVRCPCGREKCSSKGKAHDEWDKVKRLWTEEEIKEAWNRRGRSSQ